MPHKLKNKHMKIAFLSVFYPFRGGIAQYNSLLYEGFEEENEIEAYNFSRQYPQILFPGSTQYVTENENVLKTPSLRILDSINPISYYKTAKKINQQKPQLLLMGYWLPFLAPALGMVAKLVRKKGTKVISVLHNVTPHEHRLGDKQLSKFFLNQNDAFVVMSKTVRDDLLKLLPNAKYILHPFPIYSQFGEPIDKTEARKRLNIPQNKKVLLFFGLIRDYKGLDIAIDAFNLLNDDFVLIIAGECYGKFDSYQHQINNNINKERIAQHIKYITDDEVVNYFSAADLNVLPYKTATQSAVVALAYQFNSPVLVADVGGLRDMVEPYGTGLVVDKPDANLIARGIEDFFTTKMEVACKQNIKKFKEDYSWSNLAKAIEKLYKEL